MMEPNSMERTLPSGWSLQGPLLVLCSREEFRRSESDLSKAKEIASPKHGTQSQRCND